MINETKTLTGRNAIRYLSKSNPCNNMVPKRIASELMALKDSYEKIELHGNGVWYDTIYIKGIKEECVDRLVSVIQMWKPDELHWIYGERKNKTKLNVFPLSAKYDIKQVNYLRLWWD